MFAGFVARMEDTRLPKCAMFGELVGGAGCVGGQGKNWMVCFIDDLRSFDINADQWMTDAQDEGKWRRTAEQRAKHFMAKWIAAEKVRAGLRHAVVCSNMTGGTKERIDQSKWARAGSLALVDSPQVAQTCILRADVVLYFSGVTFVLRLFRFCLFAFTEAAALRSIVFRSSIYMRPDSHTQLPNNSLHPFFFFFLWRCRFFRVFFTMTVFSLYGESVVRFPLPDDVFLPL